MICTNVSKRVTWSRTLPNVEDLMHGHLSSLTTSNQSFCSLLCVKCSSWIVLQVRNIICMWKTGPKPNTLCVLVSSPSCLRESCAGQAGSKAVALKLWTACLPEKFHHTAHVLLGETALYSLAHYGRQLKLVCSSSWCQHQCTTPKKLLLNSHNTDAHRQNQ